MKTQPVKIGDRVQYTKKFARSIGAGATDPLWRRVGPVVGLGSTATTWHCSTCQKELGFMSPSRGREVFTPPAASVCCLAPVTATQHTPGAASMAMFVRVQFDGETFETTINRANLAVKGSLATYEEVAHVG